VLNAAALSLAFQEACDTHGFDIIVRIDGTLPKGGFVMACNHVSYIDPVVLLAKAPGIPIAKSEVSSWPIIGAGAKALGVLFVQRDDIYQRASILRRAVSTLKAGVPVLNFPEGTTTTGERLLPFHRGIFGAAKLAGVPVVPTSLTFADREMSWTGTQTFLPHYMKTAARARSQMSVRFGPALYPRPNQTPQELANVTREIIAQLMEEQNHESTRRSGVPETRPNPLLSAASGWTRARGAL